MKSNFESLAAFPSILSRLGIKKYVLSGLINHDLKLYNEHLFHYNGMGEHLNKIKEAGVKSDVELIINFPDRLDLELNDPSQALEKFFGKKDKAQNLTRQCVAAWETPFINKDGLVFPCCYTSTDHTNVMGDLNKTSMEDIWHGKEYQDFRSKLRLLKGQQMPAFCRNCTQPALVEEHNLPVHSFQYITKDEQFTKVLNLQTVQGDKFRFSLVIQNLSRFCWTQEDKIIIGTTNPRDRKSAFYHPSWISQNRVTSFSENYVHPGGIATFNFQVNSSDNASPEVFELVIENVKWLSNTQFEINNTKARVFSLV